MEHRRLADSNNLGLMTNGSARDMLRYWHHPSWWMLMIATPLMIGAASCLYGWYSDRAVALRQQTTPGTIVAHEPANHNRYGYTFNVNDKTYIDWQVPYGGEQFA